MEKQALQLIQDTAIAADKELPATQIPVITLPENICIHSLERYMAAPARYRAKFNTGSLKDFVSYIHEVGTADCFIYADEMNAQALFDKGTIAKPGHGEHTAKLKLKATAEFTELKNRGKDRLSQKDLAEWMEEWRDFITPIDATGEEIKLPKALASIRSFTLKAVSEQTHESRDYGATKSTFDKIDAEARDGALPWGIKFTCFPYLDLQERTFHIRFSMISGRGEPAFALRILRLDAIEELIADEFKSLILEKVKAHTAGNYRVFVGELS
ncbi:DUF2303 family protein [Hahella ganghwensis]|uniref:DUF2303 family protein n=1 Tax=Hahella ganghwensis TaxID=286420 RepID=UPI00036DCAD7|nr:DUF2303 family protein [Hahella ganghwensis]